MTTPAERLADIRTAMADHSDYHLAVMRDAMATEWELSIAEADAQAAVADQLGRPGDAARARGRAEALRGAPPLGYDRARPVPVRPTYSARWVAPPRAA